MPGLSVRGCAARLQGGCLGRSEITCLSNAKLLVAKGLCLRRSAALAHGRVFRTDRQASITVDIGRFPAPARFFASSSPRPAA